MHKVWLQGLWGSGEHLRLLDVGCPKGRMEVYFVEVPGFQCSSESGTQDKSHCRNKQEVLVYYIFIQEVEIWGYTPQACDPDFW